MAVERKKYDKEFKLKVVEVSFTRGKVKEVAEEYGIDAQMLATWRSQSMLIKLCQILFFIEKRVNFDNYERKIRF